MRFNEYKYLLLSDLYRISDKVSISTLVIKIFFGEAFKYNFWMRTCSYTRSNSVLRYLIYYPLARSVLYHYTYKFGISIPPYTEIGSGFCIGHFGGIVVNSKSVIGKNCNISQGVTLGQANRGINKGCPTLGNDVYIGPGAKIVGAIVIGNNVAIGANCVVTKNIPENSVVVGVPGKIISQKGSSGYINRTDYEDKLC